MVALGMGFSGNIAVLDEGVHVLPLRVAKCGRVEPISLYETTSVNVCTTE